MEQQPNQRSSGVGSLSRKGKKKADPDQPKKIYRGLGIAELERIRLGETPPVQGFYSMTQNKNAYPSTPSYFPYTPVFATNNAYNGINAASQNVMEGIRVPNAYPSYFGYTAVLTTSSCNGAAQSVMLPLGDVERTNVGYSDHSHSSTVARLNAGIWDNNQQQNQQQSRTRNFQSLELQEKMGNQKKKSRTDSMGPGSSQNSGSSGSQEIDLELKLDMPSGSKELDLNLKL